MSAVIYSSGRIGALISAPARQRRRYLIGEIFMLTAVVGINWGDEGKGRMVDLLSSDYDVVIRYQGGNNAGHTVINDKGKFVLNLLPSGILRENTVNVMGCGMVIDIEHLYKEIGKLVEKGIKIGPANLRISDKATVCMPYHRLMDNLEEDRLGGNAQGSTRRGIAPSYSDKYMRKSIRMMDLLYPETLDRKVKELVEWKNLVVEGGYKADPIDCGEISSWLHKFGDGLAPYICDTTLYLSEAIKEGKNIMFEAQLGALRDIDFGIFPYTSSSSTLAAYAPIGSGVPFAKLDRVIGITKAFSSSVGGGPFTVEMLGEEGDRLREAGEEYGAATGRARRMGPFDAVATRYGVMLQGATELALTKLDILSYMDKIPVCVAYDIDGERVTDFPVGDRLERAKPIVEYMEGFRTDISGCRRKEELPKAALDYIRYVEDAVGCRIRYVSVGASREQYIVME